ncbi:hypothetical protein F4779DRAFT_372650 [Xylariaceae sp. FL0662B]|nr:hypothetical protein F4779DRAFT_372650 [Xylariaceae sp. FL0662B]
MNNGESQDAIDYLARFEDFRRLDQERQDITNSLVFKYQDLERRFKRKCKELDDEVETRTLYQDRAKRAKDQLKEIEHKMEANSFVVAIIDGDGAVFRDDWIAKGEEGGMMAAHHLRTAIKAHLKSLYPDVNVESWHIVVQIFLNLDGLARKLSRVGLTESPNELPAFARAFGRAQGLFSIVDVGYGKEQADFKVRETLHVAVHNLQCRHIIFGPCHDRGYLVELKPYQLETSVSTKLTLLETTPAPCEFRELKYPRVAFPEVFRSKPLPEDIFNPMNSAISLTPVKSSANNTPGPTPSWKSSSQSTLLQSQSISGTQAAAAAASPASSQKYCLVNAAGERIDEPIKFDKGFESNLLDREAREGRRKPCNKYHLNGICEDLACSYYHGEPLSPGAQLVLRNRARGSPCAAGQSCRNVNCLYGHHCKYGKRCKAERCPFSGTHVMDMTPAERIYEDGTRDRVYY